jgi:glycosyltransferase involved in cell wall biosynthesis
MLKRSLLITTFNYGGRADQSLIDYMIDLNMETGNHPAFGFDRVYRLNFNTTPLHMARNRAVVNAEENGIDYLMMLDSDMAPDLHIDHTGKPIKEYPNAKPFFTSSINWMLDRPEPTVVAAPYCGPPPRENMYVFRWGAKQSDCPGPNFSVDQYSREEAAGITGIKEVAALPTGVILIDMRVFKNWSHPRFYYEYTDERCVEKASTEDVTFSRDTLALGYKAYCNWDAWAGHNKFKCVGKPHFVQPDDDVLPKIKEGMNFYKRIRETMPEMNVAVAPSPVAARDDVPTELQRIKG